MCGGNEPRSCAPISEDQDVIGLLRNIKAALFNHESQQYPPHALHLAKQPFYSLYQEKGTSVSDYQRAFQNAYQVVEHYGCEIGADDSGVHNELKRVGITDLTKATELQRKSAMAKAEERYLACAFLLGANRHPRED